VRGKDSKLGEPCPKVRLSQDRLPKEPSLSLSLSSLSLSLSGPLCAFVVLSNIASRKCHSTNLLSPFESYEEIEVFYIVTDRTCKYFTKRERLVRV
jgi:hypothetical protein